MILNELSEKVESVNLENTFLYFITRVLRPEVKARQKVMDKFLFKVYQVDINDDIRSHLHELTKEQLSYLASKKTELHEYDVITDDTEHLFTYQMAHKAMSFSDVVYNQLKARPQKIVSLEDIVEDEELWAYCVGFYQGDNDWIYTFRKILSGKVAIDEKDGSKKKLIHKAIRTYFNTNSQKLELFKGQTVNLDKLVDCIFYNETFYIARKRQFEQIVGLEAEYKETATTLVKELKATQLIAGIDILIEQVEKNTSLHKKLVRITRIGNYRTLDANIIQNMERVSKLHGSNLKIKEGKIVIEDEKDIEETLRMLADYYKTGQIFGFTYGTYAGKQIDTAVDAN